METHWRAVCCISTVNPSLHPKILGWKSGVSAISPYAQPRWLGYTSWDYVLLEWYSTHFIMNVASSRILVVTTFFAFIDRVDIYPLTVNRVKTSLHFHSSLHEQLVLIVRIDSTTGRDTGDRVILFTNTSQYRTVTLPLAPTATALNFYCLSCRF